MLKFIKSLFKKPEAKVEAPATVEIVPAGTEASVAAPVAITPAELQVVAEISDSIHDTDKPAKVKKAPAAKKAPAVKKPRAPKKPKAE